MCTDTASIVTTASPQALWRLFEDVAGWTGWNAGMASSALQRPFATGSTLAMQPPGMDDTRFLVSHELQVLPAGGTRVVYAIRVEGPEAATLGPLVTADFPEVLAALKALAEQDGAEVS